MDARFRGHDINLKCHADFIIEKHTIIRILVILDVLSKENAWAKVV